MSEISKSKSKKNKNVLSDTTFSRRQVDSIVFKNKIVNKKNIFENKKDEIILNSDANVLEEKNEEVDDSKRMFLKIASIAGLGVAASAILPKQASAYVTGSTPTSNVVGLKDDTNNRINPATEETLSELISGQNVSKLSISLSSSGVVHTPASGKRIRVYASRFSLTADATSVSFRFTSSGLDHEKYVSPKTGGLYGANNHPNYIEGGVNEVLYCAISGSTTVQINIDYLEV